MTTPFVYLASAILAALIFSQSAFAAPFAEVPVAIESRQQVVLSLGRAGTLVELVPDVGSEVRKGALVARLDTRELELQIERNNVQAAYLGKLAKTTSGLVTQGLKTPEELARTRAEQGVLEAENRILRQQIEMSRLLAPFSGAVVERPARRHQWIEPGMPIIELVDNTQLRAVGDVSAEAAAALRPGAPARLVLPDLGRELAVQVEAVSRKVEVRSNTVRVMWTVPKGTVGLVHGMKGVVLP
jgi:RND family efflux transporter MFP subunit